MAQQPLSAAIARLETQLGVRLLDRTTRRVALTEAGEEFLEAARVAIQAADTAVDAARLAASGVSGEVSLGISAGAWYGLAELFAELRERHPGLRLNVRQQSSRPLVEAVRAGQIDLAIGLCVAVPDDLASRRLKDDPVVLVVSTDHPAAERETTRLDAVSGEVFALDEPAEGGYYNAAVLAACAANGFHPEVREFQTHHDAWERAIAAGECVGLTTSCSLHAAHPGVHAVFVDPPATFPLDLLWRPGNDGQLRPAVRTVIDLAGEIALRERWTSA
jgi:DNA-binding transcriptional LysR family regulator